MYIYIDIYIYVDFFLKNTGCRGLDIVVCVDMHFQCAQVMFKLCMFVIFCPDLRASSRASWTASCACSPC